MVSIDLNDFVRTRDALSSSYMGLSSAIDRAVKAYVDHTNVVLAGDASLNISFMTQPFDQLVNHAQLAQQALHGAVNMTQNGDAAAPEGKPAKRQKRAYKPRDKNAPKRPLTAYFRFLQEQRTPLAAELAAAAGGVPQKPGDLTKEATDRWNKLPEHIKQPYRDAYQRALKDYEKDVVKYKAAGGQISAAMEKALARGEKDEVAAVGADQEVEDEEEDEEEEAVAEDEEEDDDDDDDEDDEDEEEVPPPPPPPKAASPVTQKKTPKSAVKKVNATPSGQFSSIDPALTASDPTPAPASSPERKRKAVAAAPDAPAEGEASKKKRGRKSNAEKAAAEAEAEAAAAQPAAPVAPMASSDEPAKKKKKKKADA